MTHVCVCAVGSVDEANDEADADVGDLVADEGILGGDVGGAVSEADVEMQKLVESQVESHKIGSAIAEEALRRSSLEFSPELPADLLQDAVFNQNVCYLPSF